MQGQVAASQTPGGASCCSGFFRLGHEGAPELLDPSEIDNFDLSDVLGF